MQLMQQHCAGVLLASAHCAPRLQDTHLQDMSSMFDAAGVAAASASPPAAPGRRKLGKACACRPSTGRPAAASAASAIFPTACSTEPWAPPATPLPRPEWSDEPSFGLSASASHQQAGSSSRASSSRCRATWVPARRSSGAPPAPRPAPRTSMLREKAKGGRGRTGQLSICTEQLRICGHWLGQAAARSRESAAGLQRACSGQQGCARCRAAAGIPSPPAGSIASLTQQLASFPAPDPPPPPPPCSVPCSDPLLDLRSKRLAGGEAGLGAGPVQRALAVGAPPIEVDLCHYHQRHANCVHAWVGGTGGRQVGEWVVRRVRVRAAGLPTPPGILTPGAARSQAARQARPPPEPRGTQHGCVGACTAATLTQSGQRSSNPCLFTTQPAPPCSPSSIKTQIQATKASSQ